jgi:hypothetical protein
MHPELVESCTLSLSKGACLLLCCASTSSERMTLNSYLQVFGNNQLCEQREL